jgi:fructokinase
VIAVAGEALVDLVPADAGDRFDAAPGGSPANVAVTLARLEVPVRLLARLSSDLLGRRLRRHLEANGVDLAYAVRASEPTTLALVALDDDGVAEYDFRVDGTADWQWRDDELEHALEGGVVALHSGSLALTMPPGAAVLRRLLERARATATVSYDPNCRPLLMGSSAAERERVDDLVRVADVVKVSSEDLTWLLPGREPEDVAADWLSRGPALVVVTLGADGALAAGREAGLVQRPGETVEVVDTVGAGDAFTGALLAGLYERGLLGAPRRAALGALAGDTLGAVLDEAVRASALTCERRGADPPTRSRLAATVPTDP